MATNKNTPQNVNKSPDKKKGAKKKSKQPASASKSKKESTTKKTTGIAGTQLGTGKETQLKEGKVTTRKVRDLG